MFYKEEEMDTNEIMKKLNKHLTACCEYITRVYETDEASFSVELTKDDVTFYGDNFKFDINYFELEQKLDRLASKHLKKRSVPIVD